MTISKILVAHDFSEAANRALRFAAELARATNAKLELAYVQPDLFEEGGDPLLVLPLASPDQRERYTQFVGEELKRVAAAVVDGGGELPCHILRGDPVKRITELARERAADVICLAATGKGAVQRVLLGSVSQLVLRSASVPVLLVP